MAKKNNTTRREEIEEAGSQDANKYFDDPKVNKKYRLNRK